MLAIIPAADTDKVLKASIKHVLDERFPVCNGFKSKRSVHFIPYQR